MILSMPVLTLITGATFFVIVRIFFTKFPGPNITCLITIRPSFLLGHRAIRSSITEASFPMPAPSFYSLYDVYVLLWRPRGRTMRYRRTEAKSSQGFVGVATVRIKSTSAHRRNLVTDSQNGAWNSFIPSSSDIISMNAIQDRIFFKVRPWRTCTNMNASSRCSHPNTTRLKLPPAHVMMACVASSKRTGANGSVNIQSVPFGPFSDTSRQ